MNPEKCSLTVTRLARLARLIAAEALDANVAGITYDPAFDRPARLRTYGADRGMSFSPRCSLLRTLGPFDPFGTRSTSASVSARSPSTATGSISSCSTPRSASRSGSSAACGTRRRCSTRSSPSWRADSGARPARAPDRPGTSPGACRGAGSVTAGQGGLCPHRRRALASATAIAPSREDPAAARVGQAVDCHVAWGLRRPRGPEPRGTGCGVGVHQPWTCGSSLSGPSRPFCIVPRSLKGGPRRPQAAGRGAERPLRTAGARARERRGVLGSLNRTTRRLSGSGAGCGGVRSSPHCRYAVRARGRGQAAPPGASGARCTHPSPPVPTRGPGRPVI